MRRLKMRKFGRHFIAVLMAVLAISLLAGCTQAQEEPVGTLSVTVSSMEDAKTITPTGHNEITHYRLEVVNTGWSDRYESDYMDIKAGTYVIEGLPYGSYYVWARGYTLKDGEYIQIASGRSDAVNVRSTGTTHLHILLDELFPVSPDEVDLSFAVPEGSGKATSAHVIFQSETGYSFSMDMILIDGAMDLDEGTLFDAGGSLYAGTWTVSGSVYDETDGVIGRFREIVVLEAGQRTEGVIMVVPFDGGEPNPYVKLVSQHGDGLAFIGSEGPSDSSVTIHLMLNGVSDTLSVLLEGVESEYTITEDEATGGFDLLVSGLQKSISDITITADDGSSIIVRVYDLTDSPVVPGVTP